MFIGYILKIVPSTQNFTSSTSQSNIGSKCPKNGHLLYCLQIVCLKACTFHEVKKTQLKSTIIYSCHSIVQSIVKASKTTSYNKTYSICYVIVCYLFKRCAFYHCKRIFSYIIVNLESSLTLDIFSQRYKELAFSTVEAFLQDILENLKEMSLGHWQKFVMWMHGCIYIVTTITRF